MTGRIRPEPLPSYLDRLMADLDALADDYAEVLNYSTVVDIDPDPDGRYGIIVVGLPLWAWGSSDSPLEAERMRLLGRIRDWAPRLRLLFPHPVPEVADRLDKGLDRLDAWLLRQRGDHTVPSTTEAAHSQLSATVGDLRGLSALLPADAHPVRLAPDTNALIDEPDLAAYRPVLGPRYMAHVLPVVLGELDDLKRGGRNEQVRDGARAADRRLKGLRDNGDVRVGARVAGEVLAVFEHIEPAAAGLPSWLDLSVPDDRFVASCLRLQSAHPGSALSVATSDLNLQTKLATVGLPFVEPPARSG